MNNKSNLNQLKAGDSDYKAYVGPPEKYDLVSAMQFNLLTFMGLRDDHKFLDIGCGSLRAGKLLIPFLKVGNYYGIEPNNWLIEEGIKNEIGNDLIKIKSPHFINSSTFEMQQFGEKFDFLNAQSIFSHTSLEQIRKCLEEAKKVLKSDGIFTATFVLGENDYEGSEWVYPGCVTFKHETILKLVKEQNLNAIKINWLHPNNQTYYVIFHKANEKDVLRLVRNLFYKYQKPKIQLVDRLKKYRLFNNSISKFIYNFFKIH